MRWTQLQISREYLGQIDGNNYYIKLPGNYTNGWWILAPTKLVRVNENEDTFVLLTKPDFEYSAYQYNTPSPSGQPILDRKLTGSDVMSLFQIRS